MCDICYVSYNSRELTYIIFYYCCYIPGDIRNFLMNSLSSYVIVVSLDHNITFYDLFNWFFIIKFYSQRDKKNLFLNKFFVHICIAWVLKRDWKIIVHIFKSVCRYFTFIHSCTHTFICIGAAWWHWVCARIDDFNGSTLFFDHFCIREIFTNYNHTYTTVRGFLYIAAFFSINFQRYLQKKLRTCYWF